MVIIIEGPDGSGKSTLAKYIAANIGWPVVSSRGKPKSLQEMLERTTHYLSLNCTIIDRHPCCSELIYGSIRGQVMMPMELLERFGKQRKIIIYSACMFSDHVVKEHDTPEHLELLARHKMHIVKLYEEWAIAHADIIYRDPTNKTRIVDFIKGAIS